MSVRGTLTINWKEADTFRGLYGQQITDQVGSRQFLKGPRKMQESQSYAQLVVYQGMIASHPYFLQQNACLKALGLRGVVARYTDGRDVILLISFSIIIPAYLLHKVLTLEIAVRRLQACWSNISLLWNRLNVRNIVPGDSDAMIACHQKDIVKLRDIFANGYGTPNDTTESGQSLIQVCVMVVRK